MVQLALKFMKKFSFLITTDRLKKEDDEEKIGT